MKTCDAIRERLAEDGIEVAEASSEVAGHLETCPDCRRFLGELERLDAALAALPEQDAPDALVAKTLQAVRNADGGQLTSPRSFSVQRSVGLGLAASVVIAAGLGLTLSREWLSSQHPQVALAPEPRPLESVDERQIAAGGDRDGGLDQLAASPLAKEDAPTAYRENQPLASESASQVRGEGFETAQVEQKKTERGAGLLRHDLEADEAQAVGEPTYSQASATRPEPTVLSEDRLDLTGVRDSQLARLRDLVAQHSELSARSQASTEGHLESMRVSAKPRAETAMLSDETSLAEAEEPVGGLGGEQPASAFAEGNEAPASEPAPADDKNREGRRQARAALTAAATDPAAAFLERYRTLEGLAYQEAAGYWANGYIPGDPAMRQLKARLRTWNRGALGRDAALERAVKAVPQPFDAPQDAALALYLNSDTPAVDGPTRMRLQVGIKGAERQGGHRPAMNVGLVLDLRDGVDSEGARRIRALVAALERARQPEDRFSVTVAGADGGLLVPPDLFRHGPLRLAMERLLGAADPAAAAPKPMNLSLPLAVTMASRSVRAGDDPGAVLGSSLILLVTGSSLANDLEVLERMAHLNAVDGVPLSIVSLAARDDLDHIDRLVAAGQGSRRILDSAQAAEGVIDRELHASSRAVARALRLRIRLAPGVKLIDVLGSRRLDEALAERVREAEVAIDRRLARNLGIKPDRGEDEEGIQIVIPNFYADDSHTILLDLEAAQPGPVADVTLRYKDLVYLRNGVARGNLTAERGPRTAGPLERNVQKNLVAWESSRQIREAAAALREGDSGRAARLLGELRDLVRGLRQAVAGWQSDPDLIADEALLDDYLSALAAPAAGDATQRRYLADSLRYAAFRKLQTAQRP